jgi:hypothetical protein
MSPGLCERRHNRCSGCRCSMADASLHGSIYLAAQLSQLLLMLTCRLIYRSFSLSLARSGARSIDSICTNWLLKSVNLALGLPSKRRDKSLVACHARAPSIRDYFAVSRLQRGSNCGSISQDYRPAAPRGRLSPPICLLFAHLPHVRTFPTHHFMRMWKYFSFLLHFKHFCTFLLDLSLFESHCFENK